MSNNTHPWYYVTKDKQYKVNLDNVFKSYRNPCANCKYLILTKCYQNPTCGSRYCEDCYKDFKQSKQYYCKICEVEDTDNMIHKSSELFHDKATEKELIRTDFSCLDCNEQMKLSDLLNHLSQCPKQWIKCIKCDSMLKISDKDKHLCKAVHLYEPPNTNKDKKCTSCGKAWNDLSQHNCSINWKEKCPFNCELQPGDDLQLHRQNKLADHLDIIWHVIQDNHLDTNSDDPNYKKICDAIAKKLSEQFDVKNLEDYKHELNRLNTIAEEELKIYNKLHDSIINDMNENCFTSFDGTLLWRIDNWSDWLGKAKLKMQTSIFSPEFYTSRFGYKMRLRLYPNGDKTAENVGMSLFIVIMRGNYDNILNWPFKQKVTFILIDQEFISDHIDAFVPTEGQPSFAKPRSDMNIPAGSNYFIKFEDLKQRKYIENNTMFIRCIVDCSDLPD